jgi:hypothetical protein
MLKTLPKNVIHVTSNVILVNLTLKIVPIVHVIEPEPPNVPPVQKVNSTIFHILVVKIVLLFITVTVLNVIKILVMVVHKRQIELLQVVNVHPDILKLLTFVSHVTINV